MPTSPTTISSWALMIARALDERGADAPALFRRAGLDPVRLRDPTARYPVRGMQRLWRLAVEETADSAFGLAVARQWHPTTFHGLGYAWLASPTLLVALGRLMRYFRVITNSGWIDFRRGQAGYLLTLQADAGEAGLPGQPASAVFDAALLTILTMCRAAAGPSFAPSHVQFVRPPPNDARPYEEAFAAPVSFGQLVDGMVLEIAAVESPLPHGNLALARSAEEVLDRYLAQMGGRGLAVRVMAAMAQGLPSGTLSQEGVARALNVSVRTLQRRLREEGASFRGLLERTRRDLALRYVAAGTMSLGEIAFMLGFSDPSNLTRAFRRWTGASPTVWRGRHADDAGAS